MPTLIQGPTQVPVDGAPIVIREYVGRVNTGESRVSIAHLESAAGWQEPGQRPEFDEYTIVLRGLLRVEHEGGALDVRAGQAVLTHRGEWVRYSSPSAEGAAYIAVCLPAFSLEAAHRDAEGT